MNAKPKALDLSASSLSLLPVDVRRPLYDRGQLRARTVHLGVGSFHRAHQAVYLDDLLGGGAVRDWGECGLGVMPQDNVMRDLLHRQDYLYTVLERSAAACSARVIGSMMDFVLAPEDPASAIERLAHPDTCLVSLTITEGGYFLHEATGEFAFDNPSIQHDILFRDRPLTSLGLIAAALGRRRDRGQAPFTVMSCDNLQGNGNVTRKVLLGLAERQNPELHQWIAGNVAFPNSMVDRITPATSDADRDQLRDTFGINDGWPVVTEPFTQWVIEDTFSNARPPWEEAGAEIVTDVLPYELMKIRLLNASHMAMAYLGALKGHQFAHKVIEDPVCRDFIIAFLEEVTPVVPLIAGTSIPAYKRTLMERFGNPTLNDRVARLCSEGSAKMPKWVLPSIVELDAMQRPTRLLSLVIAAWIKYLTSPADELGSLIDVVDARAEELKRVAASCADDPRPFLTMTSLFGAPCFAKPSFERAVREALQSLRAIGVEQTLCRYGAMGRTARRKLPA